VTRIPANWPTVCPPHGGYSGAVQATGQAGHGRLYLVELVEDDAQIVGAGAPEQGALRSVRVEAQGFGIQVGGLHDDESFRGKVVDERAIAPQRRQKRGLPVPVRKQQNRQIAPRGGHRHL
jgi:hypothetical protein